MNRADFQKLTRLRLMEAKAQLRAGLYDGADYLAGYAVERAIKACICRRTKRYDFPDKGLAEKAWSHRLTELLSVAELDSELKAACKANRVLEENRAIVKNWKETKRYDANTSGSMASDFYAACTGRANGILPWLRSKW